MFKIAPLDSSVFQSLPHTKTLDKKVNDAKDDRKHLTSREIEI
jgi:hypothetical protein